MSAEMTCLVEATALADAAEYLMYPGAMDAALDEARRHDHRSFIWSIACRADGAAPARDQIDACLAACASSRQKTRELIATLRETQTRPVFRAGWVQLGNAPRYVTRRPERVLAIWDLLHPAQPMTTALKAEPQLESVNPAVVYRFFNDMLREDKIAARAAELDAAIVTLGGGGGTGDG
jgi:hypothetical protein